MKGFIAFVAAYTLGKLLLLVLFLYSFFVSIKEKNSGKFFMNNALTLDILGNVNGQLIERLVTCERDTLFGREGVTISASLGELEYRNKLNKKGLKLSKILNFVFREETHCLTAYQNYLKRGN